MNTSECCSTHSQPRCRAGRILLGGILGLALAGAFGFAVKYLWNHVMPGLFPVPSISFWQAIGLLLLGRLLFGRFGCHGRHHWFRCHSEGGHTGGGRFWKRCCRSSQAATESTPENN